jgi:quercetin dioxygenase-like cupin family protein
VEVDTMKRSTTILSVSALVVAIALTFAIVPSMAQTPPPPIAVEELTSVDGVSVRGAFTDDVAAQLRTKRDGRATGVINMKDPSRIAVARITVQPGAQFPWHTHHGPVVVSVAQGELIVVDANDCIERAYHAGSAFIDPGRGNVHTAFNPGPGVTILAATFLEAPASGPLTLPVAAPADCQVTVGPHTGH